MMSYLKIYFQHLSLKLFLSTALLISAFPDMGYASKASASKASASKASTSKATDSSSSPTKITLELWSRGPGDYVSGNPKRIGLTTVAITDQKTLVKELFDFQYDKDMIYKGVSLSGIISRYTPQKHDDTVILHFSNRMIFPMKLSDRLKESILIATAYKKTPTSKNWSFDFPNLEKKDTIRYYQDPNPTVFEGNKMAVPLKKKSVYFKNKTGELVKRFSPWLHTASLIGVEFVNGEAYDRQFEVSQKPVVMNGLGVFKARCQYCHGVRGVGASFGWDFVEPIKISEKRGKKDLHLFVKYPKAEAFDKGLQMPNQIDLAAKDTEDLWEWINATGNLKIKKYAP